MVRANTKINAAAVTRSYRSKVVYKIVDRCIPFLFAALLILAWQILVPLFGLSNFVLPTPTQIGMRIVNDFSLLLSNARVTVLEVLAGFFLSASLGIPVALAAFYSRIFERAVYPMLVAFQTVPKVALAPLLVLYLGYGWSPKIALAFLISFFPIVISTVVGLRSLDPMLVDLVRSMGASEWQTFIKIRLPAALPNILGGFKIAITLAVIGAVIGEYVAASQGLGFLQLQATAQFDTTLNYACIVMISIVGIGLYSVLILVEKKLTPAMKRVK